MRYGAPREQRALCLEQRTGARWQAPVSVTDFSNSYMTFFAWNEGNIARIQLDAACTLVDEADGSETTYYLIAPCRAERMYLDT